MKDLEKHRNRVVLDQLDQAAQDDLFNALLVCLDAAPLFRPVLPRWGTPFTVLMSNCGSIGWVSDRKGYRYQPTHPETGKPWPPMPDMLVALWHRLSGFSAPPEACLINYYAPNARMGLHQDRDEADFSAPVLSVSLGDTAKFRLGGETRHSPTESFDLMSGDVMILAGRDRLAFHGINRIYPGTSDLLSVRPDLFPDGGRLNLTLRRVTPAP